MEYAKILQQSAGKSDYRESPLKTLMKVNELRKTIDKDGRVNIIRQEPYANRIQSYLTKEELKRRINLGASTYKSGVQQVINDYQLEKLKNDPLKYIEKARKQTEMMKLFNNPSQMEYLRKIDPVGLFFLEQSQEDEKEQVQREKQMTSDEKKMFKEEQQQLRASQQAMLKHIGPIVTTSLDGTQIKINGKPVNIENAVDILSTYAPGIKKDMKPKEIKKIFESSQRLRLQQTAQSSGIDTSSIERGLQKRQDIELGLQAVKTGPVLQPVTVNSDAAKTGPVLQPVTVNSDAEDFETTDPEERRIVMARIISRMNKADLIDLAKKRGLKDIKARDTKEDIQRKAFEQGINLLSQPTGEVLGPVSGSPDFITQHNTEQFQRGMESIIDNLFPYQHQMPLRVMSQDYPIVEQRAQELMEENPNLNAAEAVNEASSDVAEAQNIAPRIEKALAEAGPAETPEERAENERIAREFNIQLAQDLSQSGPPPPPPIPTAEQLMTFKRKDVNKMLKDGGITPSKGKGSDAQNRNMLLDAITKGVKLQPADLRGPIVSAEPKPSTGLQEAAKQAAELAAKRGSKDVEEQVAELRKEKTAALKKVQFEERMDPAAVIHRAVTAKFKSAKSDAETTGSEWDDTPADEVIKPKKKLTKVKPSEPITTGLRAEYAFPDYQQLMRIRTKEQQKIYADTYDIPYDKNENIKDFKVRVTPYTSAPTTAGEGFKPLSSYPKHIIAGALHIVKQRKKLRTNPNEYNREQAHHLIQKAIHGGGFFGDLLNKINVWTFRNLNPVGRMITHFENQK
jgi:hypothetical protein